MLARVKWDLALNIRENRTLASRVGLGFTVEILTLYLGPTEAITLNEREQV